MNAQFERLAPFIALSSAIILAAVLYFVLSNYTALDQAMSTGLAMLIGGANYFLLRFVFAKAAQSNTRDN